MTGNSGRPGILAFVIDNLVAMVAAFIAVAVLKSANPYVGAGVLSLTYLGYFFLCEALWSRTPGKYLQGLVVIGADGGPCGWRAALARALFRAAEANPLLFGGLPAGAILIAMVIRSSATWPRARWTSRPGRPGRAALSSLTSHPHILRPGVIHLSTMVSFSLWKAPHL